MKAILLFLGLLSLPVLSLPAETVEWDFTTLKQIPQTVWKHTDNDAKLTVTRDDSIQSPAGTGALKAEITQPGVRKNAYDIQLNFTQKAKIADGKRYRITFLWKASRPAKILTACFTTSAPYTQYGQPDKFTNEVDDTWREQTLEFVGMGMEAATLRVPVFALGTQPEGQILWIAKLKFEEL